MAGAPAIASSDGALVTGAKQQPLTKLPSVATVEYPLSPIKMLATNGTPLDAKKPDTGSPDINSFDSYWRVQQKEEEELFKVQKISANPDTPKSPSLKKPESEIPVGYSPSSRRTSSTSKSSKYDKIYHQ